MRIIPTGPPEMKREKRFERGNMAQQLKGLTCSGGIPFCKGTYKPLKYKESVKAILDMA